MIVSFSGLDGSGKSTLAASVAAELNRSGVPAALGQPAYHCNTTIKEYCLLRYGEEHAYHPNLDSNFYLSGLALDWIDWWLHQVIQEPEEKVFCCDRYTVDVCAQAIQYNAELDFLRQLFSVMPLPVFSFYLDITPEEASSRIVLRADPPPHALESMDELRRLRESYAEAERILRWQFTYIDGTWPLPTIIETVMDTLREASIAR